MYYKVSSAKKIQLFIQIKVFDVSKNLRTLKIRVHSSSVPILIQEKHLLSSVFFSLFGFSIAGEIEKNFSENEFMPEILRAKLLLLPISVQILATIIPRNVRNFHLLWQLLTKRSEYEPITQSYRVSTRNCVTFNKIIFQAWQFI